MVQKTDVVVIGAGVTGLSTAYELAIAGVDVLVVDKSILAAEASGRNPGGIRLLGRDENEVPLMLESMKRWHRLEEELELDMELRADGNLWLAFNERELKLQRDMVARDAAFGIEEYILVGNDLKEFAPGISTRTVVGALWSPGCCLANPFRVAMAYYRAARKHGAQFWFDTEVTNLTVQGGRVRSVVTACGEISANTVVIAAGPWSIRIGQMVGLDIPIEPRPYQIHITEPLYRRILPLANVISSRGFLLQSPRGHVYSGDSNIPENQTSFGKTTSYNFMLKAAATFSEIVPEMKSLKLMRSWVGIIDFTPDDNFIFGQVEEVDGVILACGFSGHGFAMNPIIGQLLKELICQDCTSLSTEAFNLNRFKGNKTIKQKNHFAHQHMDEVEH